MSPLLQERYLAAADRISGLAVGDTEITRGLGHVPAAAGPLAGSAHRGTAARHGRRAGGQLHLPARRRVHLRREAVSQQPGRHARARLRAAARDRDRRRARPSGRVWRAGRAREVLRERDPDLRRRSTRACACAWRPRPGRGWSRSRSSRSLRCRTPNGSSRSCAARSAPRITPAIRTSRRSASSGPFAATGPGDTPSRKRLFVCRPTSAASEEPCARQIIETIARRAYRRPIPSAELEQLVAFYRSGDARAPLRAAHPADAAADPRQPEVRLPRRARSRRHPGRRHLPHQRPGSGVAPLVLPLEHDPGRPAAGPRQPGKAQGAGRVRGAGPPHAGRPQGRGAGEELCRPVAAAAQPAERRARPRGVPELRRQPAERVRARDRDALRQRDARGPQRDRPPERRLHVRQRAAGPALPDSERLRQSVPARAGEGRCPARHPGARQHADGDVARGDHVAGAARQVDPGELLRHAAAAAPARGAGARGQGRVGAAVDACSRWRSTAPTRRARRATS